MADTACFADKLIVLVKRKSFLYNSKSPKYKHNIKRERAWEKISEELGIPTEMCKLRWKSLRDRFVRERKKIEQYPDIECSKPSQWEYYSAMEFLLPMLRKKKNTANNPSISKCKMEVSSGNNTQSEDYPISVSPSEEQLDSWSDKNYESPDDSSSRPLFEQILMEATEVPSSFKTALIPENSAPVTLGTINLVNDNNFSPENSESDNDLFMDAMKKKMKILPMDAKHRIQEILLAEINKEMELVAAVSKMKSENGSQTIFASERKFHF